MEQKPPSLDEIRTRRAKLRSEDEVLAEIEESLLRAQDKWAAYNESRATIGVTGQLMASPPKLTGRVVTTQKEKSKNDLIVEALSNPRSLWQTANQVQAYLSEALGRPYPRTSVSPALTALKKNETIVRRDMHVALTLRVEREEPEFLNENGPPNGGPDTGGLPPNT